MLDDPGDAALIRALASKQIQDRESPVDLAFGQQRAAIQCGAKQVALMTSGRAGKTTGFLLKWRQICRDKPGFMTPFVALTRQSAKRIMWPILHRMNRQYDWGLKFNESDLTATDPQGSELFLIGANKQEEIEKLRGIPVPLAGIDECASFRPTLIKKIVQDVIGPRLLDLDGELWALGTPGVTPAGYFFDVTTGRQSGWEVFKWSFLDNPHLPLDLPGRDILSDEQKRAKRLAYLLKVKADNEWPDDNPTYQREWLGQWVRDEEAQVYKYDDARNGIDQMPDEYFARKSEWIHVIWHDYGYVDSTAWGVNTFRGYGADQTVYTLGSFKIPGKTPSQAALITAYLVELYNPEIAVGDTGGLGKGYTTEYNTRHGEELGVWIEAADKQNKRTHIEFQNDGMLTGRRKFVRSENVELIEEMQTLQWDEKYEKTDERWHTVEDERFENHLADGNLYGSERCRAYFNSQEEPDPVDRHKHDPNPDDDEIEKEYEDGFDEAWGED